MITLMEIQRNWCSESFDKQKDPSVIQSFNKNIVLFKFEIGMKKKLFGNVQSNKCIFDFFFQGKTTKENKKGVCVCGGGLSKLAISKIYSRFNT